MTLASYHITVIGTGQMGCSIGAALRACDLCDRVRGYDLSPAHLTQAAILGAVDETAERLEDAVRETDIIILCSPLHTMEPVFTAIGRYADKGAVVTDVGSVKAPLIGMARRLMPGRPFVPGHPIAGTEKSGPLALNAELFANRKMIVTPEEVHTPALAAVQRLWEAMGAKVEVMEAGLHDRIYGQTSHFAQLLAWVHASVLATAEGVPANPHFYPFIRIGGSDIVMWLDIFMMNRAHLLESIGRYEAALRRAASLEPESLAAAAAWRRKARTLLHPDEWGEAPDRPHLLLDVLPVFSALACCMATLALEEQVHQSLYPSLGAGFYGITRPASVEAAAALALLGREPIALLADQILAELAPYRRALKADDKAGMLDLINAARGEHVANVGRWGFRG